jgi:hypothetical protein
LGSLLSSGVGRYGAPATVVATSVVVWLIAISAMLFITARSVELTPGRLTRDVASLANFHPITGALSTLGLLLWAVGIGAVIASWLAVSERLTRPWTLFLLTTAAFTGFLLFDDAFQFHETLAVRYLGLPERAVMAAYPVITLGYLAFNVRVIRETEVALAITGFALLALSMGIDMLPVPESEWGIFIEDALKFGGIVFWTTYLVRLARTALRIASPPASVHSIGWMEP